MRYLLTIFQSDQRSEESISPSPPVVSSNGHISELDLNHHISKVTTPKQPFLKFSVSAILSKAKAEIAENEQDQEAVKSSENNIEGKTPFYLELLY